HSLYAVFHRDNANLCLISSGGLDEWMSRLPSRLRISSLSIPGTHNSPTHHVALPSVRCQAIDIPTQLRNGIRFLDIRIQPDDALNLVHGVFPIAISGNKPLRGVIDAVYTFLEQHSRETVILSLKREGRDVGVDDKAFSKRIYDEIISKRLDKWHLSPTIPTLGEARGKVILFRRFHPHAADIPLGIDASHWAYNTPHDIRGVLSVQDFCEVAETENIDIKLTHIKTHLERASNIDPAMAEEQSQLLYVNFLSASNFWKVGCWPERVAAKVNPEVEWWLARKHKLGRGTGVVVLDFVGEGGEWGICRLVTGMNGGL
ncbi:PLC-like phosphodiesterase, partial [Ascodesmis nigricans]